MLALRFLGLLAAHAVGAVYGTAFIELRLWDIAPSHSIRSLLWKEFLLSVLIACVLGFAAWRAWRTRISLWAWVLPAIWFAFGVVELAGHGDLWGQLFGRQGNDGSAEISSFFLFTVPLIRATSYSIGALICSYIYPTPVPSQP